MKDRTRGKKARINILMSYLEMLLELIRVAVDPEDKKKYQARVDRILDKIEGEMEQNPKPKKEEEK